MADVIVYIPTTKERLRCDECSRSFQTPQGLASHQRNYHHGCPNRLPPHLPKPRDSEKGGRQHLESLTDGNIEEVS